MGEFLNQKLKNILQKKKERRQWVYSVIGLSLAILVITNSFLTVQSMALAQEEHTHTDDCYEEQTTQVCGQEESDGHHHTDDCYTSVRGELVCQDTSEEHVHSDECYEWNRELTCALEEGEGAHHHSEECFQTERILVCGLTETRADKDTDVKEGLVVPENDTEDTDDVEAEVEETNGETGGEENGTEIVNETVGTEPTGEEGEPVPATDPVTTEPQTEMPAKTFEAEISDGTEDGKIKVVAEAVEGTFPAGTRMEVKLVENEEESENTMDAAEDAISAKISDFKEVRTAQILDIRFFDVENVEVAPLQKVRVTVVSDAVKEAEDILVIYVDDEGWNETIRLKAPGEGVEENTIIFDTFIFGKYVVVGMETVESRTITAAGDTYEFNVTYGPEAAIPSGTQLIVTEFANTDNEFNQYVQRIQTKLGGVELAAIKFSRFFKIELMKGEDVITPAAPVQVTLKYAEAGTQSEEDLIVVKLTENTEEITETEFVLSDNKLAGMSFRTKSLTDLGVIELDNVKEEGTLSARYGNLLFKLKYIGETALPDNAKLKVRKAELTEEELERVFNAYSTSEDSRYIQMLDEMKAFSFSIVSPEGEEITLDGIMYLTIEFQFNPSNRKDLFVTYLPQITGTESSVQTLKDAEPENSIAGNFVEPDPEAYVINDDLQGKGVIFNAYVTDDLEAVAEPDLEDN